MSVPLPPHAPCRLEPSTLGEDRKKLIFASTRPVQIGTRLSRQGNRHEDLCLHTPRADWNHGGGVLLVSLEIFASTRPVQIGTAEMHRIAICTFQNVC